MARFQLDWLPDKRDWIDTVRQIEAGESLSWATLAALANARMDVLRTDRLDRLIQSKRTATQSDGRKPATECKLAILASCTVTHLLASIRVAALRRGIDVTTYEPAYGQYRQELLDPRSGLHAFKPTAVLFVHDAQHVVAGPVGHTSDEADEAAGRAARQMRQAWALARDAFHCMIIQQTILPTHPSLFGSNEHRLPGSPAAIMDKLNALIRDHADADGVHLLAIDKAAAQDGMRAWHDPVLWHQAKQDISPAAAPLYGDLVARLIAAQLGRSSKCLVLDLDNTLWGGVIGDDGLEGIVLGQNSALGEAFVAVQRYARDLSRRGVVLAVCSKNDEATALSAFERHPEMVLRRSDIASFVANWDDKATNLRRIASDLNLGLDSLVFLDDNPFERNLVRQFVPEVVVIEVPDDDPALVPQLLADSGYFEAIALTEEDLARSAQYQANRARQELSESISDLPSFLRELDMRLVCQRFDTLGLPRIVQLINKTNQFNLTTRRVTADEIVAVMHDPRAFGLQLRLIDRYGDNGVIAIVIGRLDGDADLVIDTWLMSCRVLGRNVEEATLDVVRAEATRLGARRLVGIYRPTAKNAMVADHYGKLGFSQASGKTGGDTRWTLDLADTDPRAAFVGAIEMVGT